MDTKILSVVGLVLAFLVPLAGIIISAVALNKMKQYGTRDGKEFAALGLVIGIIMTVVIFLFFGASLFCLAVSLAEAGY